MDSLSKVASRLTKANTSNLVDELIKYVKF